MRAPPLPRPPGSIHGEPACGLWGRRRAAAGTRSKLPRSSEGSPQQRSSLRALFRALWDDHSRVCRACEIVWAGANPAAQAAESAADARWRAAARRAWHADAASPQLPSIALLEPPCGRHSPAPQITSLHPLARLRALIVLVRVHIEADCLPGGHCRDGGRGRGGAGSREGGHAGPVAPRPSHQGLQGGVHVQLRHSLFGGRALRKPQDLPGAAASALRRSAMCAAARACRRMRRPCARALPLPLPPTPQPPRRRPQGVGADFLELDHEKGGAATTLYLHEMWTKARGGGMQPRPGSLGVAGTWGHKAEGWLASRLGCGAAPSTWET